MSIPACIQHPENFSTFRVPSYYNLWSANNTTTGYNDAPVVKTIYDPCPAGFKMPASNAFTGFIRTGNNTANQSDFNISRSWYRGHNFNNKLTNPDATVFFPAAGCRDHYNGSLPTSFFTGGWYWSAIPFSTVNGCFAAVYQAIINPLDDSNRANGFSVRPVAE